MNLTTDDKSRWPFPNGRRPISEGSEWTFELIGKYDRAIAERAARYGLDIYPNQIEVITAEQMMDAYASNGMPINYQHWSFGKRFLSTEFTYKRGAMGLAYEIVINSNPCIAYLMEENTMPMQALVIAHAAYGHNSFFKGNHLFRGWTQPDAIIDYLAFFKNLVAEYEVRYGEEEVERVLDAAHAIAQFGVDRYKRPPKLSAAQERFRLKERQEADQARVSEFWHRLERQFVAGAEEEVERRFPSEPQENLLYFIEKNSEFLKSWERELLRGVRKISQYFYPQRQTQVMNEGWATFWHYTLLYDLYADGLVNDAFMKEFIHSHTNVTFQPDFDHKHYGGINPYALGFAMYRDLRRIAQGGAWMGTEFIPNDTKQAEEDRLWFPDIAGISRPDDLAWVKVLDHAMRNFKDESFIQQFLSPKVIRDFHLFVLVDDEDEEYLRIGAIHDDPGYREVREALARQYSISLREPNIQVYSVDVQGDRTMTLRHFPENGRDLVPAETRETLKHVAYLWGWDVVLDYLDDDGKERIIGNVEGDKKRRRERIPTKSYRSVD